MGRTVTTYKEQLMRPIRTLGCVFALAALVAAGARADENDRLTYLTFSGPVQLPGVTLAAGTYTFKLADLSGSKHVVHVMTKEESPKLITTLMTIPNERLEPVQDTYIMFQERPAGMPQAMKAWFYPGRSIGEEFIYPKQQAVEIAQANNTSVLSSEGDTVGRISSGGRFEQDSTSTASATSSTTSSTTTADSTTTTSTASTTTADASNTATTARSASTTRPSDSSTTTTAATAAAPVAAPPAPVAEAEVVTPAPAPAVRQEPVPVGTAGQAASLPRTSSPLALFELISGLSIAGGLGLRQLRKRA
jgi:hypothetical protein